MIQPYNSIEEYIVKNDNGLLNILVTNPRSTWVDRIIIHYSDAPEDAEKHLVHLFKAIVVENVWGSLNVCIAQGIINHLRWTVQCEEYDGRVMPTGCLSQQSIQILQTAQDILMHDMRLRVQSEAMNDEKEFVDFLDSVGGLSISKSTTDSKHKGVTFLSLGADIHAMIADFAVPVRNYCRHYFAGTHGEILGTVCRQLSGLNLDKQDRCYGLNILEMRLLKKSSGRIRDIIKMFQGNIEKINSRDKRLLREVAVSIHTLDLSRLPDVAPHLETLFRYFLHIKELDISCWSKDGSSRLFFEQGIIEQAVGEQLKELADARKMSLHELQTVIRSYPDLETLHMTNTLLEQMQLDSALLHPQGLGNAFAQYSMTRYSWSNNALLVIVSALTKLKKLSIGTHSPVSIDNKEDPYTNAGLRYLGFLKNLEELRLFGFHRITSDGLRHLRHLTKLKKLDLSGVCWKAGIGPIVTNNCGPLEELHPGGEDVRVIREEFHSILPQLAHLRTLDLSKYRGNLGILACISQVPHVFTQLTTLHAGDGIVYDWPLQTIGRLSALTHLALGRIEAVALSGNKVNRLNAITQLTKLTRLEIGLCELSVDKLSIIAKMETLRELYITYDNGMITQFEILALLPHLKELGICPTLLSDDEFDASHVQFILDAFPKLEWLYLAGVELEKRPMAYWKNKFLIGHNIKK